MEGLLHLHHIQAITMEGVYQPPARILLPQGSGIAPHLHTPVHHMIQQQQNQFMASNKVQLASLHPQNEGKGHRCSSSDMVQNQHL